MIESACLFGTYASQHSANRLLRATLEAAGYTVVECHAPLWERTRDKLPRFFGPLSLAQRSLDYVRALPRLLAKWRAVGREARLLVVGFNGQLDLLVARRLARGRIPVLFVPLVTVTETLVDDRQVYAPGSLGARFAQWLDRTTLGGADLVIADTEAHRAYMCETFGVEPSKTRTLYLGAESFFHATPPLRDGAARSVLFYGQYVSLHGASTIVDAARRLNGTVEMVMVGTGPDRPKIEAQARGIPNVRFVDWVPYERLPEWIGKADMCLGAFGISKKAAMVIPNKVYQAAAGGRPVVSADTPAVREIFKHGENIWLIPAGDGVHLAEAISALAADGELRRGIGCSARALMRDSFGEGRQGERLRALIGETIGAGDQRRRGKSDKRV